MNQRVDELKYNNTTSCLIYLFTSTKFFYSIYFEALQYTNTTTPTHSPTHPTTLPRGI